jgi:molecular chaperone GrpE
MDQNLNGQENIYEEIEDEAELDVGVAKEKIGKLNEKLKKCQEEKQEYLTGWQREKADFINFKRRYEEQAGEWLRISQASLIHDILPIVDAFEATKKNQESRIKPASPVIASQLSKNQESDGILAIGAQLAKILEKYGLEEIKAVGEKFNPEFHEAVESAETAGGEEGKIMEEMQKGYLLNGKVLRTSKVKVIKNT